MAVAHGARPQWIAVAFGVEALSFVAIWELQRIALQTRRWFPVWTSQLAGNAFGRIVPGGAAAAGALQYRMLDRSGIPGARIASALTAVSVLLFGAVLALPVLSLPAIVGGTPVASGLAHAAYLGAIVFGLMLIGGAAVFVWDRPLAVRGRAVERVLNATVEAEAARDRALRAPAGRAGHPAHDLRAALAGGRPRRRRQVDPRLPGARRLPARCRRRAEPVARASRLRRRARSSG